MGYESKMYIVDKYSFTNDPPTGHVLAMIELSKCGYYGATHALISKHTQKPQPGGPPYALYAGNPDRQQEAVVLLRELAEAVRIGEYVPSPSTASAKLDPAGIEKLSNDIEDGYITTDRYGDSLAVIEVDDMIAALEEDIKTDDYRRYKWALVLLKEIKDSYKGDLKVVTYGH